MNMHYHRAGAIAYIIVNSKAEQVKWPVRLVCRYTGKTMRIGKESGYILKRLQGKVLLYAIHIIVKESVVKMPAIHKGEHKQYNYYNNYFKLFLKWIHPYIYYSFTNLTSFCT